jgi:hypothetical protein
MEQGAGTMTINITPEIGTAYRTYVDEVVDHHADGRPILRRSTYPFIVNEMCGIVDFAAGWQASRAVAEPRLLQDETQTYGSKGLSRWFASRPDARREAREVAHAILPGVDLHGRVL